jgi:hypothetical protein
MQRKILYLNKKYHSGKIWIGDFILFLLLKFSLSLKIQGKNIFIFIFNIFTFKLILSLIQKYLKKGIEIILLFSIIIELEPIICNFFKCFIFNFIFKKGKIKCLTKNNPNVFCLIKYPFQIQYIFIVPK